METEKPLQPQQPNFWRVQTTRGEVRILSSECMETWPCQGHSNNLGLNSVQIWELLKENPQLQKTEPSLWNHFKYLDTPFSQG
jgi:hypothetical protein